MFIKEFRIPMPMTVDEYQVAQLYSVVQASRQNTNGDTGIEILVNEPYENEHGKGQYTHKLIHLGSQMPRFVAAMLPESAKTMIEKAWNAYPYCRTEYSNAYLGEKFSITVESMHVADEGSAENIHKLSPADLKIRKVQVLNIGTDKHGSTHYDPSKFHSKTTGRGPLDAPDWPKRQQPIMCCYKLVTVKFHVFGLQTAVEHLIDQRQMAVLLDFHKQVFCTIDEWHHLDMQAIRKMEDEVQQELRRKIQQLETGGVESSSIASTSTPSQSSNSAGK